MCEAPDEIQTYKAEKKVVEKHEDKAEKKVPHFLEGPFLHLG